MAKKETTTKTTEKPVKKVEELTPEEVFSDKQDTLLTELEKDNAKLKEENESLFKDFQKIDGENTELMGKVETLEKIVLETTGIRDKQATEIQELKDKVTDLEGQIDELHENYGLDLNDATTNEKQLTEKISNLEEELKETKEKLDKYERRREPQIKPKQGVAAKGYFNGNMYGNDYGMY